MRILFFGDVVGKNGREALKKYIRKVINEYRADFVIVNGENASHGKGLLYSHYKELSSLGVDAITLGNHYLNKDEIEKYIDKADKLVRPLNIKNNLGGFGSKVFEKNGIKVRVTNVLGEAFMKETVEQPYVALTKLIIDNEKCIHFVDYHAESTSEKQIMGYCFDGQISAIVGTHTHVQTNDARILKNGTGFMCDVGMCGQYNGVIGFEQKSVIDKIVFERKSTFDIDENDVSQINAVVMDIDEKTYMCKEITPIRIIEKVK